MSKVFVENRALSTEAPTRQVFRFELKALIAALLIAASSCWAATSEFSLDGALDIGARMIEQVVQSHDSPSAPASRYLRGVRLAVRG